MMCFFKHHILYLHQTNLRTSLALVQLHGNIFNILLILGASAAISPMTISMESIYDGAVLLVMSILLFFLAKKGEEISRKEAVLLLVLYGGYTAYIIMR